MPASITQFDPARELLQNAKRIAILSHKSPDADAIGANLALREALENMGKEVTSACVDAPPENCLFLRKADTYQKDFNPADFDLIVTVDCGGHKQMAFHETKPELLDRSKTLLLNIDHHPSNDNFGTVNMVMSEAPATCFILFLFFTYCQWGITPTMATALMHGLYYDTGSFQHSNTDATGMRIAARLLALGADHASCVKEGFHTHSLPQLRLWGRALERLNINSKKIAVTALTQADYEAVKAEKDDVAGLVTYVGHTSPAKFCILLTEDFSGNIKASMRTQGEEVDLTQIAGLFGGGGHKKASGFTIAGHLAEKRVWSVG